MDSQKKTEEFFNTIIKRRKTLIQIPFNYSQGEIGVLLYLTFEQDGIIASELSEILQVTSPRMVSILHSLEKKKLITKVSDSEDRRRTIIYVTDIGKKLVLDKKKEATDKVMKILEHLKEEEIDEYLRIVKKIGTIIDGMQE